jgi:CubicO group peptidase (beta-lactamase class C family)
MFAILKKTIFLFMLILSVSAIPAHGSSKGSFDDTLVRFDSYARNALREWSVPGMSIVVVKGDRVVYAKGFGTKRFGVDQRVTTDTVFQVGSVTKAFTVALVGQLVDSGSLGWDDRVVDHYSGFRMFDPWVTKEFRIHDLFAQHSGMPN